MSAQCVRMFCLINLLRTSLVSMLPLLILFSVNKVCLEPLKQLNRGISEKEIEDLETVLGVTLPVCLVARVCKAMEAEIYT